MKVIFCELSSRNFQAQPQLSSSDEPGGPVAPVHGKPAASILFSRTAILNGEGAILCENPGGGSEYSTALVAPLVTSSKLRYIRRFAPQPGSMRGLLLQYPELADTRRRRQQQPSGTSQLSSIEKETIRWKGKPWLAPSPVRPPNFTWYILWNTYRHLDESKRPCRALSPSR